MPNMQNEKTPMPLQEGLVRITNFEEVALGYTEEQMINEADRCLHCVNHPCTCLLYTSLPNWGWSSLTSSTASAWNNAAR